MTVIGSRFSIPGAIESRRPARFLINPFGVASRMQISHVPCHLEASYQFRVARLPTCLRQSNAMSFVRGLESRPDLGELNTNFLLARGAILEI
jgi:hypothetical protein